MILTDAVKSDYTDQDGVVRRVLITDEEQEVIRGVPLLDVSGLGLPKDIEVEFLKALNGYGILEYSDALKPGGAEAVAGALRSALRVSVHDVLSLCQREQDYLKEAGYDSRK